MKLHGSIWMLPALLLLALFPLNSQETRGTLVGRVTDPTNAAIVGVKVDATNSETGVHFFSTTNSSGDYIFPLLLPGPYTIAVEHQGFKKYTRTGIVVRVNDRIAIDVPMEVGVATQTVEVTAESPMLDTSTASIGQVVDSRAIQDMPLMGGMVLTMATLSPGMTFNPESAGYVRPFDTTSPSTMSADGSSSGSNQFMMDGAPNMQRGEVAYSPPPGVVDEFKVQTASFDASTGFMTGAVVNMSLKSGGNKVHGQVYYFMQNPVLSANKFFRLVNGKPQFRMYRWGASLSGPVVLPKIYDGHNKTFWMYGYEGIWSFDPSPWVVESVPTAAQRTGNLSDLLALGSRYQIYDPYSIATAPNGRTSRLPLTGNLIPDSQINPISRKLAALWDSPNRTGTVDGTNNYTMGKKAQDTYWNHIFRVDHNLSSRQRLYVRGNITDLQRPENVRHNNTAGDNFYRYNRGFGIDDVYVVSPTFFVNTRYTLTRFITGYMPFQMGWDLAGLGFSSNFINQINQVDPRGLKLPQISVSGLSSFGGINNRNERTNNTHELAANITTVASSHTMRYGVTYRVYQDNNVNFGNSSGSISFGTNWNRGPLDNSSSAPMGQGLAGFLYGIPASGSFPISASVAEQSGTLALFFQDDWKWSRKLTLSIGLRYELESPLTERFNRSVKGFIPDVAQPIQTAVLAKYALNPLPEVPVSQFKVVGGLTFAGVKGEPRELWENKKKNFMPRFGFAYSLTPKTVLRGGYAIYFEPLGVNSVHVNQIGFSRSTDLTATIDNGLNFIAPFANPFPSGFLLPYGAGLGIETNLGQSVSYFDEHMGNPYTQRWQFAVQRQLPANHLIEVSYVGNRATKQRVGTSLTATPAQYLSTKPTRDQATIDYLSAAVTNPFYPLLPGTDLASTTVSRSRLLRAYPQFSGVGTTSDLGYSWYHALQVRGEKRFSAGLNASVSYTWSKNMSATGYLNGNLIDAGLEEVISSGDRTNRLAVTWIYELPFGQGRRFGASVDRVFLKMISGWQVTGIYTAQSGAPLGFGNVIFMGDLKNIPLPKDRRNVDQWFNINAGFERDNAKQLGSNIRTFPSRFGGVRADGANNWDMSVIKNTRVKEKIQIQFRAEAMNALNHPQFTAPNTSPTSTAFGTVTGEFAWPRVGQFGLKVLF